ncbi:MAG: UTP--glucose-1-phosphate uridylyltransferase [Chlamydiota bacterium]
MTASLIGRKLEEMEVLMNDLHQCSNKLEVLNAHPLVREFFSLSTPNFSEGMSEEEEIVVKSMIAIGQGKRIFVSPSFMLESESRFRELMLQLLPVERFYAELGGIIGYYWQVLQLMKGGAEGIPKAAYHRPQGIDITIPTPSVAEAIFCGIKHLPEIAEIYPVGGAADRLRLHDERTGLPLPAARLIFCGRTLLEWLIFDLQAREYLRYKTFGNQVMTPIAMMTSHEKDNHAQIQAICEENRWFLRSKESFRFFCQPSVPAINQKGDLCLQGPLRPLFKPGGHGVIWKLARDEKVFDWLFSQGRKKALIRQINNPIAGCDHGLLAFCGLGCKEDKIFGFASCPRHVKASEGVNVLIERLNAEGKQFLLTNIEYCDFKKFKIVDEPVSEGSIYSKFSSNTNILFADLQAAYDIVAKAPLPGMLVNFKKSMYRREDGRIVEEEMGRLESTMQNIADLFEASEESALQTFLTYNERRKTISTVKREFVLGSSLLETPDGCFLDLLKNARDLLVSECGFLVPEVNDPTTFFIQGPSFIFLYHPALGPLYSIIAQKLQRGILEKGSELVLNIAEVNIENLELRGSLLVHAEAIMGHEEGDVLCYSELSGKCVLKNVSVRNKGIDWEASNVFWRSEITRKECFLLLIKGSGEFYAEDVIFEGDFTIEVESGTKVTAIMEEGCVHLVSEPISAPSWYWEYRVDEQDAHLLLEMRKKQDLELKRV